MVFLLTILAYHVQLCTKRSQLALSCVLISSYLHAATPSFIGLGHNAGEFTSTTATAITDSGNIIAGGGSSPAGFKSFRWSADVGMGILNPDTGGFIDSRAYGISADGNFITGRKRSSINGREQYIWNNISGISGIGGQPDGVGKAISDDGSIIAGWGYSNGRAHATRWDTTNGLNFIDISNNTSSAWAISADGSIIAGMINSVSGTTAYVWSQSIGMQLLGDLPGGVHFSSARGLSSDGDFVVGVATSANGQEAFHWTQVGGMIGLGDLSGGGYASIAHGTNQDGSIIVGSGTDGNGSTAIIWHVNTGMQKLETLIQNTYALDITGWRLTEATAISADGKAIVGHGINPMGKQEAWLLQVDAFPVSPDGDINLDGVVNVLDVLLAKKVVLGEVALNAHQLLHGDVAPLVNNLPAPDQVFNVGDLLVIQQIVSSDLILQE